MTIGNNNTKFNNYTYSNYNEHKVQNIQRSFKKMSKKILIDASNADQTRVAVTENDNLDEFGLLLNEHWELKKNTSNKISNSLIDKYYNLAINNGASGGKLIGAGGGGFLMFYSKNSNNKKKLRKAFSNSGLQEIHMPFELSGSKIALNISGGYK